MEIVNNDPVCYFLYSLLYLSPSGIEYKIGWCISSSLLQSFQWQKELKFQMEPDFVQLHFLFNKCVFLKHTEDWWFRHFYIHYALCLPSISSQNMVEKHNESCHGNCLSADHFHLVDTDWKGRKETNLVSHTCSPSNKFPRFSPLDIEIKSNAFMGVGGSSFSVTWCACIDRCTPHQATNRKCHKHFV